MHRYQLKYQVRSGIDGEFVGEGSVSVEGSDRRAAGRAGVAKVHDTDPRCDDRIDPYVQIVELRRTIPRRR